MMAPRTRQIRMRVYLISRSDGFRGNEMASRPIGRIGACAAALMCAFALTAGPAAASKESETYIGVNAQGAISSLAASGTPAERSAKFGALMEQFADVGELSSKVLGVYGRGLRDSPALKREWTSAFRDYAMTTYEDQLDKYRTSTLTVTGSRDAEQNGKLCSRVSSQLSQKSGKPVNVYWYLCKIGAGAWRVTDVGLDIGGGEIKMLLSQRAQFESVLGQNGGDVGKLAEQVEATTATMRARIASKHR